MAANDHLGEAQFGHLWHVTTRDALPSIKRHGLNNEHATAELWTNIDDWDDGAYMWDSPKAAIGYAHGLREMGHQPVVLRVNPKGLDLEPDDTGTTEVKGAYHAPSVPARNVEFPRRYRK